MEPPNKRRRLSPVDQSNYEFNNDTELQIARARNDQKLKSLFEGIFEKYGKDFSDVGDEIDLRTGEIVVNKGHVSLMGNETDTGEARGTSHDSVLKTGEPHELDHGVNGDDEIAPTGKLVFQSLLADDEENEAELPGTEGSNGLHIDPEEEVVEEGEIGLSGLRFRRHYSDAAKPAVDPLWRVPEIDAKFWTPPKLQTPPKKGLTLPDMRPSSPPTAGSIWAIRTPGRPRGQSARKQTSTKKSTPSQPSRRRRKKQVVLDWSFANMKSDDSDSDDPLLEEAPPSISQSAKAHGHTSLSITPTPTKNVARNATTSNKSKKSTSRKSITKIDYERPEFIPLPQTPEIASSPQRIRSTPAHACYKELSSPTKMRQTEFILTPNEVKLIVQMKSKSVGCTWEEVAEHLPGRTAEDLQEWEECHPDLFSNNSTAYGGWSQEELSKLDNFADQSGIWWQDIQAALPSRSRRELESQMIKIWMEKEALRKDLATEAESREQSPEREYISPKHSVDDPVLESQPPHALLPDEDDPESQIDDAKTNHDPKSSLEEESDDEFLGISSIKVDSRPVKKAGGSRRNSPWKGSASPRKFF